MYAFFKRTLDILIAAIGLVLLAPLIGAVAAAISLTMRETPFFRQVRPGRYERPFTVLKFRTMRTAKDPRGSLLPDERRLTRLGRCLRKVSADELPQFWNVLRGEMSLVGPRPLLMEYLPRYSPRQRRRQEVKPGITGWAQVNGRNTLSWEEKFDLDVWYVDHQSLRLDLKILWLTLLKVVRQQGISQVGHATMPEFLGSPSGKLHPK
jgi:lipopolysaccharide/colanic/teichoic acid biosynthesis glycosyltransferase